MKFFAALFLFTTTVHAAILIPNNGVTLAKLNTQVSASNEIYDCGITTSVGSSALTINLTANGSTPTTALPCRMAFRSATASTGTYSSQLVTAANSLVISSGSTLGCQSAIECKVYIYLFNDAGTLRLGASGQAQLDEGSLQSSTAEGGAGAADTAGIIYTGTAVTTKAVRVVGRLIITEATAGTWASNSTEVALPPFAYGKPFAAVYSPTVALVTTTSTTYVTMSVASMPTNRTYKGLAVAPGTANDFSLKVVSLPPGCYQVSASFPVLNQTGGFSCTVQLYDGTTAIAENGMGGSVTRDGLAGPVCYTSTQANIEFKVQFKVTAGATCQAFGAFNGSAGSAVSISLIPLDK